MPQFVYQTKSGASRLIELREGYTQAEAQAAIAKAEAGSAAIQPGSRAAEQMSHPETSDTPSTPLGPLAAQSLIQGVTGAWDFLGRGIQARSNIDATLAELLAQREVTQPNPLEGIQADAVSRPLLDAALGEGVRYEPSNTFQEFLVQKPLQALGGEVSLPGLGVLNRTGRTVKGLTDMALENTGAIIGEEVVSGLGGPEYDALGAIVGAGVGGTVPFAHRANNASTITKLMFEGQDPTPGLWEEVLPEKWATALGGRVTPAVRRPSITDEQFRAAAELMEYAKEKFNVNLTLVQALGLPDGSAASTIEGSLTGHASARDLQSVLSNQEGQFSTEALRRVQPSGNPDPLTASLGDLITGGSPARNRRDVQSDVFDTTRATRTAVGKEASKEATAAMERDLLDLVARNRRDWTPPSRPPIPPNQRVGALAVDGVKPAAKTGDAVIATRQGFWRDLERDLATAGGDPDKIGAALTARKAALIQVPVPADPKRMTAVESINYLYRLYGLKELTAIGQRYGIAISNPLDEQQNLAAIGLRNNASRAGSEARSRFDITAMGQTRQDGRYSIKADEAQSRALDAIFRGSNPEMVTELFEQFRAVGKPKLAEEAYLDWLAVQVDRSMKVRSNPSDLEDMGAVGGDVILARGQAADGFMVNYWTNMFGTEGQRESLARAVSEIGRNHGLTPEQSKDLTHGFVQYQTILALAAPTKKNAEIRLSQIREQIGGSVFRHLGQVSVITPLRQPALAWVRRVEANTVAEMSRLLTDPRAIEELIALANTPITSHRALGVITERIGAIAGVSQDVETTEEGQPSE